jgi:hypothetical protein
MEQARHEALVGKSMASKAAEYPEELCRAYATLVVKIFKTTLQMEWWRAILKKKEEVSEAQLRWLASKEKRQLPPVTAQVLEASRRVWMADNVEDSSGPTEGPSKKSRRERENENYVGGMRNPAKAVKLAEAGKDMRRVVDEVCG